MPSCRLSVPWSPKLSQGLPVSALSAIIRPSLTGRKIVRGQSAGAGAPPASMAPGRGLVVGHAAAGQVLEGRVVLDLRVERPAQLAGLRIEREQALVLRAEVERVAHLDRRDLERRPRRDRLSRQVAGAEGPRDLQLRDIGGRDLRQRRIALAELGPAVGRASLRRAGRPRPAAPADAAAARSAVDLVVIGGQADQQDNGAPPRRARAARPSPPGRRGAPTVEVAGDPRDQQPQAERDR